MRDAIDREVTKLLQDMERQSGLATVLADAEDSIAHALQDIGEAQERACEQVRNAVAVLASHYDRLKHFDEYHKIVATLAGLDMILTPGFQLIIRAETERLGHMMAPEEMFELLMRIFADLNEAD